MSELEEWIVGKTKPRRLFHTGCDGNNDPHVVTRVADSGRQDRSPTITFRCWKCLKEPPEEIKDMCLLGNVKMGLDENFWHFGNERGDRIFYG
jgi:hypothetical protein